MINKHLHPIAILKILMEQSDEEHILTQPRILELLDITEHITISRQTFYRSIAILKDFGFDIETYSDNHTGYYLRTRPFSPEEALFLCHAIDSSNDISDIEKSKVKESFLKFLSKPMSKEVLHTLSTRSIRNKNDEILINLRILAKAIYHEKMICFDYFHYNIKKEKMFGSGEKGHLESDKKGHFGSGRKGQCAVG